MTLATLGPVGFLRPAPGSWGSAAALVMGAGLAFLSPRLLEIAALVVCILGTMAAGKNRASKLLPSLLKY